MFPLILRKGLLSKKVSEDNSPGGWRGVLTTGWKNSQMLPRSRRGPHTGAKELSGPSVQSVQRCLWGDAGQELLLQLTCASWTVGTSAMPSRNHKRAPGDGLWLQSCLQMSGQLREQRKPPSLGQDEKQGLQRPPREAGHWTKVSPASLVTGFAGGGSTVASGVRVFSLVCVMWTFCRFYSS